MGDDAWWIVLLSSAVLAAFAAAWVRHRRSAPDRLRRRFGAEYTRVVEETGSGRAARRELRRRLRRVARYDLRELDEHERAHFVRVRKELEAEFVDDPARALSQMAQLVAEIARVQGYESGTVDERASDLSVYHPAVVADYRRAHALGRRAAAGRASAEELAEALRRYRTVVRELLEAPANGERRAPLVTARR